MNKELIQKFLNNACWDEQAQHELEDWINVEKFAELIVRECCGAADDWYQNHNDIQWDPAQHIKNHFGVKV